jgi:hypothetical protein
VRHFTLALSLALFASLAWLSSPAAAQDGMFQNFQKTVDLTYSSISTTTLFASGASTRTDTTSVYPTVTLNLDGLLFPMLRLNVGGTFDLNRMTTTTDGAETVSTISRNRPFFLLRSTNPVFAPGIGYFRREDRNRTNGLSDIKLINNEWDGYLMWNPEGGPRNQFQYVRTDTFDSDRTFQDTTKDIVTLVSTYSFKSVSLVYRGNYLDTSDHLNQVDTRQSVHGGRVAYADAFLSKRLSVNATYDINYQGIETTAAGKTGEVQIPVTPYAGLAALSDTPLTAALAQNPQLIDGNLTAGAGVDLGLPTPPATTQARNLGFDFLNPATVNRILVWVDQDIPDLEVSNAFSWTLYSSLDNVVWKQEASVPVAPFGPFERRFQVDFPAVTARYLKLVVKPLSAAVVNASKYPHLLVTELQPFMVQPPGEVKAEVSQTTHIVNADIRFRILDAAALYYEGSFLYNGPGTFGTHTDTISNGLSATHTFNPHVSAFGRVAYEIGTEPEGHRTATVTNATLTLDPIPTFRSSLLWTGLDEHVGGMPRSRNGFFVQNTAQAYAGVNLQFGLGWSRTRELSGAVSDDRIINVNGTITPREHISLILNYDDTTSNRSGAYTGFPHFHTQRFYAAASYDPTRTIHLVAGEEIVKVTGQKTMTTLDLTANWQPFPDGALQFTFAYNNAIRSLEYGRDRSTLAAVRWNITRRSYLDVSYQKTRSEFVFQTNESRVFSTSLKLFL